MPSKVIKYILLVCAFFMGIALFLVNNLNGDVTNHFWRFAAERVHLSCEWAMPYFTPVRYGGFHLAADTHDLLFSIYMFLCFFIPNIPWALKGANVLSSIILVAGIYQWTKYFGIVNCNARLFSGLLVAFSGYWIFDMSMHPWAHGLAYTPWVLICIEELLIRPFKKEKVYALIFGCLVGSLFLLINSGYYWLQVAAPMIAFRLIIELLASGKKWLIQTQRLGILAAAGALAMLLSWPRLGGIYEFQLKKFPRMGGEVGHIQIIEDPVTWFWTLLRSLFDGNIIAKQIHNLWLIFMWDYTLFIGIFAVIPLIIGMFRAGYLLKSRMFIALVLAVLFQCAMTHTQFMPDFVRHVCPLYKQVTWYWRGFGILLLFIAILVALGYETFLENSRKWMVVLGFSLMLLNLAEICYFNFQVIDFKPDPPLNTIARNLIPLSKPFDQLNYAPYCLGYIFGYGNERPPQLSVVSGSIYDQPQQGYYNMHDVRRLGSKEADGGYFMKHQWPLWPRKDSAEFNRFINYKQVVPLPMELRILNKVSLMAWIVYLIMMLLLLRAGTSIQISAFSNRLPIDIPFWDQFLFIAKKFLFVLICLCVLFSATKYIIDINYEKVKSSIYAQNPVIKMFLTQKKKEVFEDESDDLTGIGWGLDYNKLLLFAAENKPVAPDLFKEEMGDRYDIYFEKVVEYFPDLWETYEVLGFLYYNEARWEDSVRAYKKSIELYPYFFWSHYDLGVIYFRCQPICARQ